MHKKIALGSVQFGIKYGINNQHGQTQETEVMKILNTANREGMSIIDTASAYGKAEEVLGHFDVSRFNIVSKFMPGKNIGDIKNQFENSLRLLKVNQLYGYLAHRPIELISNRWQWEEIISMKEAGKVQKIGFSLNAPLELEKLLDHKLLPDLIQIPFNLLDNRFEKLASELHNEGVEIHSRSTFLQGLFFVDREELSSFFNPIKDFLYELHSKYSKSEELAGLLLHFVVGKSYIDKVVLGVDTHEQLKNNLIHYSREYNIDTLEIPNVDENILMPSLWEKN